MPIEAVKPTSTAPAGGWTPPPEAKAKIDTAVMNITKLLNSDGIFNYVSADDVAKAANILAGLDAASADAVVDKLSEKGLLSTFAQEAVDSSMVGGGLSKSDRATLFANMAKQLDGQTLAAVEQAFSATSEGSAGFDRVSELSQAVATHATSAAKVDFVKQLATHSTNTSAQRTNSYGLGYNFTDERIGDPEALAIATVIGSMQNAPSFARQALGALNDAQFARVVESSVGQSIFSNATEHGNSSSVGYEANTLANLGNVIAALPLNHVMSADERAWTINTKANFVELAGEQLKGIMESGNIMGAQMSPDKKVAEKLVRDSITKVLDGNTAVIIERIATQPVHLTGESLSAYAKSLLNSGDAGKAIIADQINDIRYGDNRSANVDAAISRIETQGRDGQRPVAQALGYYSGAVWSGAQSITDDKKKQAELVSDILNTALSAHPVTAVGAEFAKYPVNAIMAQHSDNPGLALLIGSIPVYTTGTDKGAAAIDATSQGALHNAFNAVKSY